MKSGFFLFVFLFFQCFLVFVRRVPDFHFTVFRNARKYLNIDAVASAQLHVHFFKLAIRLFHFYKRAVFAVHFFVLDQ